MGKWTRVFSLCARAMCCKGRWSEFGTKWATVQIRLRIEGTTELARKLLEEPVAER